MKTIVKFLLCVMFAIFMATPESVNASLSPFGMNASLPPGDGTALAADIFQDVTLDTFVGLASEMVAPAWLEILVLVSPANFPISTFLTQKTLDGIRGLAKAQKPSSGTFEDYFVKTANGETRFNSNYRLNQKYMNNTSQFGTTEVHNYKLNWGQIAVIPYQDEIDTAYTASPAATTATLYVKNSKMWTPNALVRVQNMTYVTSGTDLILFITAVGTGTITVDST
jgi:hypothetical protein